MRTKVTWIMLCVVVFLVSFTANSSQISADIGTIVDQIIQINTVCGAKVGNGGIEPEQWRNFLKLKQKATIDELIMLCGHENPTIRCYAFWALFEKKDSHCFELLLSHLTDDAEVETFFGCIQSSMKVGDFWLSLTERWKMDPDGHWTKTDLLTNGEREEIRKEIIYNTKIDLVYKSETLRTMKPIKEDYRRIREIAEDEKNPFGLITLAKYQNPQDKELIKNAFSSEETEYYAIYAAREYPDSYFYENLVQIFEREWDKKLYDYRKWLILYQALARYPNPETLALFNRTIQCEDKFRCQSLGTYLIVAITKYPNAIYKGMKEKINLDEFYMNNVKYYLEQG